MTYFAFDRTTVTPASANGLVPVYYDITSYVTAALCVDLDTTDRIPASVGAGTCSTAITS